MPVDLNAIRDFFCDHTVLIAHLGPMDGLAALFGRTCAFECDGCGKVFLPRQGAA